MNEAAPVAAPAPAGHPHGLPTRLAARLIRLRHSRGRLFYAIFLALLTGLVLSDPFHVLLGILAFVADGFSARSSMVQPALVWLIFTLIASLAYAAIWAVTMLLILPFRALPEWIATLVFIGAVLKTHAPGIMEAMPNWAFYLLMGSWALNFALIKSGLAFRPLPGLTRHHRARFSLPLPPDEAYRRLRAHPGRPHWDKGWAEVAEITPGDDSLLKVEVRRRKASYPLWLRYTAEIPGRQFTVMSALTRADLDSADSTHGETVTLTPKGQTSTLVEVHTREPHTLSTLCADPMEDRSTDYWAHAAAQISGQPDGTFTAACFRPAKA
ncbi:hypothetical protein KUV47_04155 [Vannielia litorea]|uniref:hypothetical protein n=1 Tax=Vannielia litorea TaxID=1217970 RepID=UPI001C93A804|nr:hypothetical protein [Vannielia litorea]MBY6152397.1 hypothetical protein [Vannielia litorea]